jgi:putative cardiolipin synthase
MSIWRRGLYTACLVLLLGASGCATIDLEYPRSESFAYTDTDDTLIGRRLAGLTADNPDTAGFFLLGDGIDALGARLLMAEHAERSIDLQYYLLTDDLVGRAVVRALLRAGDRGVRVRFLLDDIQTQGYDAGLAALDAHPNIEVRIFNPFAGRSTRVGDAVFDFARINRRMHNKSFTVDNQITIVGGRNIAAEYFAARHDVNFADLDVLGIGPVVTDVSHMFDLYWNSAGALPVPAFARMPDDPKQALAGLRDILEADFEVLLQTPYAEAVKLKLSAFVENGGPVDYIWAPYRLIYDSPDKADVAKKAEADSIMEPLADTVKNAREELVVISPYFVPLKSGIEALVRLEERGVDVIVVTNSLAANNHSIVHSGYAPARKPLLEHGVELYEYKHLASVAGVDRGGPHAPIATLHTKAFMVDREEIFIGSFNWDPRSAHINTELGVIIESAELGETVHAGLIHALRENTYEVVLTEDGRLAWLDHAGDGVVQYDTEPGTSFWRRLGVSLMRLLPIKGQL